MTGSAAYLTTGAQQLPHIVKDYAYDRPATNTHSTAKDDVTLANQQARSKHSSDGILPKKAAKVKRSLAGKTIECGIGTVHPSMEAWRK